MRESIEFWSVLFVLCLGGRIDRYCLCVQVRLVLVPDLSFYPDVCSFVQEMLIG